MATLYFLYLKFMHQIGDDVSYLWIIPICIMDVTLLSFILDYINALVKPFKRKDN